MTAPSPSRFFPEAVPPAGGAPSPDAFLDARFFEHPFPETLSPEALFDRLLAFFREARGGRRLILAIDGRSAAGKSTLAGKLKESLDAERLPAALFHMDDFFLPPEKEAPSALPSRGRMSTTSAFWKRSFSRSNKGSLFPTEPTTAAVTLFFRRFL